jgi:hypothetical protein
MSKDLERRVETHKAELSHARQAKREFSRPRSHAPIARALRYFTLDKEQRRRMRVARLAFRHR